MTAMSESLARARSVLFVPGHRPDRFDKAAATTADTIVLDLEDAVGPDEKPVARKNVAEWLAGGGQGIVRINDADTSWYSDDVAMLAERQAAVMLPKITHPGQVVDLVRALAPGSCVIAILETAAGVLNAQSICSVPGVVRAAFGNADLGSELGLDPAHQASLVHARAQVVLGSAAAGIVPPIDGATLDLTDRDVITADATHAAELGFTGKVCLHPRQVDVVNAVFTPSPEAIEWARRVLAAADSGGSIKAVDNQIVGKPIIDRAKRLLAQAGC
ncbi:CoA ester lyase [Amycolatopsis sp. KNN50.9b]|nr:CoA ester lyase [Amycolatopsis sp. KNN50.9b]